MTEKEEDSVVAAVVKDGARRAGDLPGAATRCPPLIATTGNGGPMMDGSSLPTTHSFHPSRDGTLPPRGAAATTPMPTFPRKAAALHNGQLWRSVFHSPVWWLHLRSCITMWYGHAPSGVRGAAVFIDVVDDNKDNIGVEGGNSTVEGGGGTMAANGTCGINGGGWRRTAKDGSGRQGTAADSGGRFAEGGDSMVEGR
jgi:hypothetical protein